MSQGNASNGKPDAFVAKKRRENKSFLILWLSLNVLPELSQKQHLVTFVSLLDNNLLKSAAHGRDKKNKVQENQNAVCLHFFPA